MSSNGYSYGGGHHHHSHHPNSPLPGAQNSYSMPPLQPGVPLLSTGPLGGPSTSGHNPGMSHGLPSLHQSHASANQNHHPLSYYSDPYASSYAPVNQPQHHYTPQYVPRPISAASNHHSPVPTATNSSVISAHGQQQSSTGLAMAEPPSAPATTGAGTESPPPPPTVTKARSSVACALCRKQKMKCEGPDKKPCRRCRAAGVDCVFEAPPIVTPKPRGGTGVTEAWVESKLSTIDQRVTILEENTSSSVVHSPAQSDRRNDATTSDHERRIAALEAQLYALQLQAAQAPARQPQLDYSQSSLHPISPAPPHHSPQQSSFATSSSYGIGSPANGHALPPFQPGSNLSLHNRYNSASSLKHEVDSQGGGYTTDGMNEYSASKRWKGDDRSGRPDAPFSDRPDFISRGVVTEEEAAMCYDSYFLTFAANTPHTDQRNLTFAETRQQSPVYLATIVSIGARSLSRFDTFHAAIREALHIASEMFMPDNDGLKLVSSMTIKAIILLGLYYSLPHLLLASGMLGYRIGLRTALDEFEILSEEDKAGPIGKALIGKGRMFFVSYLWTAFYTYQAGEPTCYDVSMPVLRRQIEILVKSQYADPVADQVIRTNLEECAILLEAFKKLGDGMGVEKWNTQEIRAQVDQSIKDLIEWNTRRADTMTLVSQWGDSQELKAILPFHHGRQCLMRYIFRPEIPLHEYDRHDPKIREYAIMAMESALTILRWGVESRIWMPFSIVGGYVHAVNIPASLHNLFTGARLFPDEADFHVIRPLLHRLLKQCDLTIRGAASTRREIHRAETTKAEVLEFDRFAFEASGVESMTPVGTDDQPGLVGHEIGQSLASFRLELNLWSAPLRIVQADLQ